ncbi:hypothetical protein C8J57DRAFT_1733493 [Mycena rebaudengoi]|nr:hypothetical protein C8J57DRAFT_1733493 [Mycena rebaudengoi]
MASGLALSILFVAILSAVRLSLAGNLDVLPSGAVVPQCSELKVMWDKKPPLHLHVQPGLSITETNLIDLGTQNDTFTNFRVALPIGQKFSFAYNTLADEFSVFQSRLIEVSSGSTDCLTQQQSVSFGSSSSAPSATSPTGVTASTSSGAKTPKFPVAAIIGIVCAVTVVVLIALVVFWTMHRRSVKKLIGLHADPEGSPARSTPPVVLASYIGSGRTPPDTKARFLSMAWSTPGSSSNEREINNHGPVSHKIPPKIDVSRGRRLVLNSPPSAGPSTAVSPPITPRVHTDGGVRIQHPEELPPLYHDYNRVN